MVLNSILLYGMRAHPDAKLGLLLHQITKRHYSRVQDQSVEFAPSFGHYHHTLLRQKNENGKTKLGPSVLKPVLQVNNLIENKIVMGQIRGKSS